MAEYIEREAFLEDVEERYCLPCKEAGKDHNGCVCRACWVDDMCGEVSGEVIGAPTADVAPVVHGVWIPVHESEISGWNPEVAGIDPIDGYICSACKNEAIYDCNDKFVLSDYCPNCGARMDGGSDG